MSPEQEALKEAISIAGGQSELARKISSASDKPVRQQQVWNWLNRQKRVPTKHSKAIELVTGVPKEKLRPDIFQK